jgi:hypothetical protein
MLNGSYCLLYATNLMNKNSYRRCSNNKKSRLYVITRAVFNSESIVYCFFLFLPPIAYAMQRAVLLRCERRRRRRLGRSVLT